MRSRASAWPRCSPRRPSRRGCSGWGKPTPSHRAHRSGRPSSGRRNGQRWRRRFRLQPKAPGLAAAIGRVRAAGSFAVAELLQRLNSNCARTLHPWHHDRLARRRRLLLARMAGGWWRVRRLHRLALATRSSRWQTPCRRLAYRLGLPAAAHVSNRRSSTCRRWSAGCVRRSCCRSRRSRRCRRRRSKRFLRTSSRTSAATTTPSTCCRPSPRRCCSTTRRCGGCRSGSAWNASTAATTSRLRSAAIRSATRRRWPSSRPGARLRRRWRWRRRVDRCSIVCAGSCACRSPTNRARRAGSSTLALTIVFTAGAGACNHVPWLAIQHADARSASAQSAQPRPAAPTDPSPSAGDRIGAREREVRAEEAVARGQEAEARDRERERRAQDGDVRGWRAAARVRTPPAQFDAGPDAADAASSIDAVDAAHAADAIDLADAANSADPDARHAPRAASSARATGASRAAGTSRAASPARATGSARTTGAAGTARATGAASPARARRILTVVERRLAHAMERRRAPLRRPAARHRDLHRRPDRRAEPVGRRRADAARLEHASFRTPSRSRSSNGTLTRTYFVGGLKRPWDDEAKRFLATQLPIMVRRSGIGAESRVKSIFDRRRASTASSTRSTCSAATTRAACISSRSIDVAHFDSTTVQPLLQRDRAADDVRLRSPPGARARRRARRARSQRRHRPTCRRWRR